MLQKEGYAQIHVSSNNWLC